MMKDNTKLLHGYPVIDQWTGASSIPKYQASTFNQEDVFGQQPYTYTRLGNPTISALEQAIATLEEGKYGFAFPSGMSAISTVLLLLKSGDHILMPIEVYGGTCQFVTSILQNYEIETTFVDFSDFEEVKEAINPRTKMLYMETPSNPLLKITDIQEIVTIAKDHKLMSVIDNTFMTPLAQKPLVLGVDIVVESATKFLNGHSDVMAGVVSTNCDSLAEKIKDYQKSLGAIIGIEEAWLILRGLKTMGIRMAKSVANAEAMAKYLVEHPKVKKVYYPGLPDHPNSVSHFKQAANGGAVLSFELGNEREVADFCKNIKLPIVAISLGGVESILSYPVTMSHSFITEKEREKQGITEGLLRYSCGIEDIDDLMIDIEQALDMI